MIFIKSLLLAGVLAIAVAIGMNVAKKYSERVKELKEVERALHIFEEKIKFTFQPIPEVFEEISKKCDYNIGLIFYEASQKMQYMSAGEAWEAALDKCNCNLTKEDLDVLKGMAKMLGRTDLDGQVSEIQLTEKFIATKIEDAELDRKKNEKLYKTLGTTVGLAIVIVLA